MTKPRWVGLQNVERSHRKAPRTFSIPRSDQRAQLQPGDLVKLVFEADPPSPNGLNAERMWVRVKGADGSAFTGFLDNQPSFISNLTPGDLVTFGPEHVAAIYTSPSGLELPYGRAALVGRDVMSGEAIPAEARREPPSDKNSSGWIVLGNNGELSGLESVLVDDLIARFRVLDSILDEPVGTRWVWDDVKVEYVRRD